jgi:primosomal protein N' (replication factor Y)
MITSNAQYWQVSALSIRFKNLDYLPPRDFSGSPISNPIGIRVIIPLQKKSVVGIVIGLSSTTTVPKHLLKNIEECLDHTPILSQSCLQFCQWASKYYHEPLGNVLRLCLPDALKLGKTSDSLLAKKFKLTLLGEMSLNENQIQNRFPLLQHFADHSQGLSLAYLKGLGIKRTQLTTYEKKGLISLESTQASPFTHRQYEQNLNLTQDQAHALDWYQQHAASHQVLLLNGVTGSGKTEVYLQMTELCLIQNKQVLFLVPEIGLIPQTLARFKARFGDNIVLWHSKCTAKEKAQSWQAFSQGEKGILLGTRSALFVPFKQLGLIFVDEEQDAAYKEQQSFLFHARDLAVYLGFQEKIPVILGSATPSLESFHHSQTGHYHCVKLAHRATGAIPDIEVYNQQEKRINQFSPDPELLPDPIYQDLKAALERNEQILCFLNQRGFATLLFCPNCRWKATCPQCDTAFVLHQKNELDQTKNQLRCHHCHMTKWAPKACPDCLSENLITLGQGTQQLEIRLEKIFEAFPILRMDRDQIKKTEDLDKALARIHENTALVITGTRLLAKGHHFSKLTRALILEFDSALLSTHSRALEQQVQQSIQLMGRTGRESKQARVWIPTYFPDHPVFETLKNQDYDAFLTNRLDNAEKFQQPPFFHYALIRAESSQEKTVSSWLDWLYQTGFRELKKNKSESQLMPPQPAWLARKAQIFRYQITLISPTKKERHQILNRLNYLIQNHPMGQKVRWRLDIDPLDWES